MAVQNSPRASLASPRRSQRQKQKPQASVSVFFLFLPVATVIPGPSTPAPESSLARLPFATCLATSLPRAPTVNHFYAKATLCLILTAGPLLAGFSGSAAGAGGQPVCQCFCGGCPTLAVLQSRCFASRPGCAWGTFAAACERPAVAGFERPDAAQFGKWWHRSS